jgi:hypothetical protein
MAPLVLERRIRIWALRVLSVAHPTRAPFYLWWRRAARAALLPQAPWTPPPGWADEEAR